ncbi:DNA polymerase III subunit alpha [Oceanimonas baumannii]|uniref:DNA polymerase III subunit alpha n=1 Tax=Oceanimonas baumannii TaxID=129578 RepID=A0A235CQM2_9GAMM|nr:DNA polymerase III subunit alpha [Oceanimonas baumannii]OYD26165.1 DNA polymerase III subunit alpha [Oceanimonas baumannii]TDW62187.1 DNA polymerase-3 subunit alpha [Oceanimonas baumannii]
MIPSFIHLRIHSDFSMVDGLTKIGPITGRVQEQGYPALALTDEMNLCGLVRFYGDAHKRGLKPLIGADFWVQSEEMGEQLFRLPLLAMNNTGYQNITLLISKAYLRGHIQHRPVIDKAWLAEHSEGVIVLSGGREGDVGTYLLKGNQELAGQCLAFYQQHFPDRYYLELLRTGRPDEESYLHMAVELATEQQLPVVATNEVVFLDKSDFDAHEIRVAIHDGYTLDDKRRPKRYSPEQYLKSPEEMAELFADIPEALENSVEIAKRCNVTVRLGEYFLPDFPTGDMSIEDFLVKCSEKGLEERLEFLFPDPQVRADKRDEYDERLRIELDVINQMGFPGYFLIVMEFIQWSKDNGIPVGPGRGSGAGSLVAYALKITDLDPLEFDLLFERFLNPERVSMPDFDIDFCMDRRDEVIDHVAELYGRDAVSQIITFGTMAAKAVVRDVGRVLGHPYGFVDRISKLIPPDPGMTLAKAFEAEPKLPELYDQDEEVRALIDMARILEGVTRNAGKHAGGVVIAPTRITDFSPLYCDAEGHNPVTQFDKNDVEYAGLVKFDFLGLRTLTIIDWALGMINPRLAKEGKPAIDIAAIPIDDKASFQLLKRHETTAVFQLESRGMKDLIKRLQPDCFEDMIALVALFRPGPLQSGMVDNFIDRKHGREAVSYPDEQWQHESLQPILEPTYGIILYQEQVMQIAQVLAGYSLGGADLLRRAMGKKKPEEMAKQRAGFEAGAVANGIDGELAMKIFDLVEKFAGYGFNKSHSAAYALVSYQTLWLKTHFPAEFMAAVMTADMDNTDKVVTLVDECQRMGLTLIPPDVNTGRYRFTVNEDGHIVYGIGAIKGVGEAPIESILAAREAGGPFRDLFDFCNRVDLKKLNKRVMEKLILSGAMDRLGPHRAAIMASLGEAMQAADQHAKAEALGQGDMFGVLVEEDSVEHAFADVPHWPDKIWLDGERDTLGLYLTGHPINQYAKELRHYTSGRLNEVQPGGRDRISTVAGLVIAARVMTTKRGNRMGILTLDDKSGRLDVTLFSDALERYESLLEKDKILVISGQVSFDDFSGGLKMSAREVLDISDARERFARGLALYIDKSRIDQGFFTQLLDILTPVRAGVCPVRVTYNRPGARAELTLGTEWRVTPTDQMLDSLKGLLGPDKVELMFE